MLKLSKARLCLWYHGTQWEKQCVHRINQSVSTAFIAFRAAFAAALITPEQLPLPRNPRQPPLPKAPTIPHSSPAAPRHRSRYLRNPQLESRPPRTRFAVLDSHSFAAGISASSSRASASQTTFVTPPHSHGMNLVHPPQPTSCGLHRCGLGVYAPHMFVPLLRACIGIPCGSRAQHACFMQVSAHRCPKPG